MLSNKFNVELCLCYDRLCIRVCRLVGMILVHGCCLSAVEYEITLFFFALSPQLEYCSNTTEEKGHMTTIIS